ncbi:MAG: hypothetical protein AVDCRST_MAG85-2055, partial [uncultured Solirubrobacteraceae bacterium]
GSSHSPRARRGPARPRLLRRGPRDRRRAGAGGGDVRRRGDRDAGPDGRPGGRPRGGAPDVRGRTFGAGAGAGDRAVRRRAGGAWGDREGVDRPGRRFRHSASPAVRAPHVPRRHRGCDRGPARDRDDDGDHPAAGPKRVPPDGNVAGDRAAGFPVGGRRHVVDVGGRRQAGRSGAAARRDAPDRHRPAGPDARPHRHANPLPPRGAVLHNALHANPARPDRGVRDRRALHAALRAHDRARDGDRHGLRGLGRLHGNRALPLDPALAPHRPGRRSLRQRGRDLRGRARRRV